jgi:phosphatidylserine decarboxylase
MKITYINRETGNTETENPPSEGLLKFLYENPLGRSTLLALVTKKTISDWYGSKMDRTSSSKKIKPFIEELQIDMKDYRNNVNEFHTFNEFFYRELKPGARKIGNGLISPGDGKILAFENMEAVSHFYIKGGTFTLDRFLADNALAEKYRNASMIILRLAPRDYHRYHFPYKGIAGASAKIRGAYYSVSPYALVRNFARVFCENKREICRLQIADYKELLIIPVGATMVGSINSTYQPNTPVEKGDEMGYFAFGGSTLVLLFDAGMFTISPDLLKNTRNGLETYVKMGEEIASEK